ncbi:MAG: NifB/NifX family molybdenum-iron cluster-binding protein [Campylobacterales bacterium]
MERIKVAVPVEGENLKIVTRTGRAPFFAIFEVEPEGVQFLELRENGHAREHVGEEHGKGTPEPHTEQEIEHHRHHLKKVQLGECKYILVRGLGPNMRDALSREGITPIKISKKDGERADQVVALYHPRLLAGLF